MKTRTRIPSRSTRALAVTGWLMGVVLLSAAASVVPAAEVPDGWQAAAVREEIRPDFAYNPTGGPDAKGSFVIEADSREGLDGYWTRSFPVSGGRYYRFEAFRKIDRVALPRLRTWGASWKSLVACLARRKHFSVMALHHASS
jgi:hypothetical protein